MARVKPVGLSDLPLQEILRFPYCIWSQTYSGQDSPMTTQFHIWPSPLPMCESEDEGDRLAGVATRENPTSIDDDHSVDYRSEMQTILDRISLSSRCPWSVAPAPDPGALLLYFQRSSERLRLRLVGVYGTGMNMGRDQISRVL